MRHVAVTLAGVAILAACEASAPESDFQQLPPYQPISCEDGRPGFFEDQPGENPFHHGFATQFGASTTDGVFTLDTEPMGRFEGVALVQMLTCMGSYFDDESCGTWLHLKGSLGVESHHVVP